MAVRDPLTFVVQEHHATRLHYDFRLAIGDVLKSWAIPKGPSMNPADKRLAVLVDDHPLAYADFEGVIPEGRYGAGPVVIWDRGTYEPLEGSDLAAQLASGSLEFAVRGRRLRGAFALVKLRSARATGKEWLLIKTVDRFADPAFSIRSALTPATRNALKAAVPPCEAS